MVITVTTQQKNVCVCDYTTEKYKRKMYYYQKNNLDDKTFERPKNIKE